jgi:UbiD family decarboxylase
VSIPDIVDFNTEMAGPMAQDFQSFIDRIKAERPDEFVTVPYEVDPAHEITATVVKTEQEARKRPVFQFDNVKGTDFKVMTNLHASRNRLALALGCAPRDMQKKFLSAMENTIPPKEINTGPCKDVILKGADVDMRALPQIEHHGDDGGPYITAAISFAKDPDTGIYNCAYNRLMITGKDTTSIHLTLGKHLWEFHQVAQARGEALPVAFAIGVHPVIALGCLAIGSIDEDEVAIMGGLFGEPLEMVRCETVDLLVPAHAEMILEGEILPGETVNEGPFGEFTGYSLGAREREVLKVKAITHRKEAVFYDMCVGHLDHMLLSTIPMEANLYRAVRSMVPSVKAVRVPSPFTCYVSIEQRLKGQGKNAIMAVLGADLYIKRVVVVDQDVDVFDERQVNWAIATRCQPDRDVVIISGARGSDLDPSTAGDDGFTSKWGVDATAKPLLKDFTPRHRFDQDVWDRIDVKKILS